MVYPSGFACPALLGSWVDLVSPLVHPSVYFVLGRFVSGCGSVFAFSHGVFFGYAFPPFFSALGCVCCSSVSELRVAFMPQCLLGLWSLLICFFLRFRVHSFQLPLLSPWVPACRHGLISDQVLGALVGPGVFPGARFFVELLQCSSFSPGSGPLALYWHPLWVMSVLSQNG